MRKKIILHLTIPAILSLIVNVAGMLINYLYFRKHNWLCFGQEYYGGECIEKKGFGLVVEEIFPLTNEPELYSSSSILSFDLGDFIRSFVVLFCILFVLGLIISMISKKWRHGST